MAKDEQPKTMDIAKSGGSAPSSTSRPVITNHKMMPDPMVKEDSKKDDDEKPKDNPSDVVGHAKTIKPISSTEEITGKKAPGSSGPLDTESLATSANEVEQEEAKNQADPEKEEAEEAAIVDAVVGQAAERGKDTGNQDVEDIEKKEHLKKLINNKTYFLPIGQITRRKHNRQAIVVLVGLLLLVGLYVVADMGLLPVVIDVPVDFFK